MYTATIGITVTTFNAMQSGVIANNPDPIAATLTLTTNNTGIFSEKNNEIVVSTPRGYDGSVQFNYKLDDPNHILLGLAFRPLGNSTVRKVFPTIDISRDPQGSVMTVTDRISETSKQTQFSYVILVKQESTGDIGIIDPGIVNDPAPPVC